MAELFPWSRDLLLQHWKLTRELESLRELETASGGNSDPDAVLGAAEAITRTLAPLAAEHRNSLRDKAGRPKRMIAFQVLIEGMARSYRNATGQRATVTNDPIASRHGGPFVRLVDALLPSVEILVSELSGRPLVCPTTDYARGQEIRRVLTKAQNSTRRG